MKALEIKKLEKTYWDKKILKWISFDIIKWDFFALLGHNWAWKTTLIWIITDLVRKNSWIVKVFWENIDKNFREAKKYIGLVPQEHNFSMFSKVKDIPLEQAWYYGIPAKRAKIRTEKYLKELWLWDKRENEARQLSWWMKRRLMIVRALIHEPKLLILDEPTAWIDVELRKNTWQFLKKLNNTWTTILLTTHYLEEVEALCDNLAIISQWKIIKQMKTKELLKSLDEETIILDTKKKMWELPKSLVEKYKIEILDANEIRVTLNRKYFINELIKDFDNTWIIITSFKNESSRLEQLFTRLIK